MNRLRKKSGKLSHLQHPQKIKYIRINLEKKTNDLFNEQQYKVLRREIEENIRRWKDLPCS
jgi:hypothetical protein